MTAFDTYIGDAYDLVDVLKSTDRSFGTRGYAAPEQLGVFELGQTDAHTDIFILGTTIKNLLGKDYRERLAKVLERCTDLNPVARYQSVPDLLDAINRAKKIVAGQTTLLDCHNCLHDFFWDTSNFRRNSTPKKFARGEISFDIPNVNSGRTRDVDILIAGCVAMKSNLRGNFSVAVKSLNGEQIPLLVRRLEVNQ